MRAMRALLSDHDRRREIGRCARTTRRARVRSRARGGPVRHLLPRADGAPADSEPEAVLNPVADRHPGSRERVGLETIEVQSLEALRREVVEALTIARPGGIVEDDHAAGGEHAAGVLGAADSILAVADDDVEAFVGLGDGAAVVTVGVERVPEQCDVGRRHRLELVLPLTVGLHRHDVVVVPRVEQRRLPATVFEEPCPASTAAPGTRSRCGSSTGSASRRVGTDSRRHRCAAARSRPGTTRGSGAGAALSGTRIPRGIRA